MIFEGKGQLVHFLPRLTNQRKSSAKMTKIATYKLKYLKYAKRILYLTNIGKHSLL